MGLQAAVPWSWDLGNTSSGRCGWGSGRWDESGVVMPMGIGNRNGNLGFDLNRRILRWYLGKVIWEDPVFGCG